MSKEFTLRSPDGKETKWNLELVPKYSTKYLQVAVHSRNKYEVKTKMQVELIQSDGTKCLANYTCFNVPHFCTLTRGIKLDIWRIDLNTLKQGAITYMPNGDLTFHFELILYGSPKTTFGSKKMSNNVLESEVEVQLTPLNICENLNEFYLSKELSD